VFVTRAGPMATPMRLIMRLSLLMLGGFEHGQDVHLPPSEDVLSESHPTAYACIGFDRADRSLMSRRIGLGVQKTAGGGAELDWESRLDHI
jgi:hypothetical protein